MASNSSCKQIVDLKKALQKYHGYFNKHDRKSVLDILSQLDNCPMDESILTETLIGVTVSKFISYSDADVAIRAKYLTKRWKSLVVGQSSSSKKSVSQTGAKKFIRLQKLKMLSSSSSSLRKKKETQQTKIIDPSSRTPPEPSTNTSTSTKKNTNTKTNMSGQKVTAPLCPAPIKKNNHSKDITAASEPTPFTCTSSTHTTKTKSNTTPAKRKFQSRRKNLQTNYANDDTRQ